MNMRSSANVGLFALYGSIFLLALNGLFSKLIPLDATTMSQSRSVVACLVLVLILVLNKRGLRLASFKQVLGVYGLGVLLGLHWITYFHAMQISSVAIGMLSLFSYPVITVVLEPMFKKHWPHGWDLLAALVVFGGVVLMVYDDLSSGNLHGTALQGALFGLLSALVFSIRNTSQKYLFSGVDSISLMAHQVCAVALMLIPFMDANALFSMNAKSWLLLILLGCISTAMAHTLLSVALKNLTAKSVALISCLMPVFGSLLAWFVLGEVPQMMVFVGGAVILSVAFIETLRQ